MRKTEKIIAIFLSICIVAMPCLTVFAADTPSEKEEVVYVNLYSYGAVKDIYTVNIFDGGEITDYGNYEDVKLLNSNDKINIDGDKITFNTDKDRVYYQGTITNTQIPWNIEISYILDGKEISADELAGKSGSLEIVFKISKNEDYTGSFYDDFALQSAFTFDTEKCKNIVCEDATFANVGNDKQLSFTILPGKGIDTKITADVTDFEMDSVSINAIPLTLNIEVDDTELKKQINKLTDATEKIDDGATEVKNGAKKLNDNSSNLSDGSKELSTGAESLKNGINEYSNGVTQIQLGLNELNSKSDTLNSGSGQMKAALLELQNALKDVNGAQSNIEKLTTASAEIQKGIDELSAGIDELEKSVSYKAYKQTMAQNGLDIDSLEAGNTEAIKSLSKQIKELKDQIALLESMGADEQQIAQLKAQVAQLEQMVLLFEGNNANIKGNEQYLDTVNENIKALSDGADKLSKSYAEFNKGINELASQLENMLYSMSQLSSAVNQLVEEYTKLDSGIEEYTKGVAQVVVGYNELAGGTGELINGSKQLNDGAGNLYSGVKEYVGGVATLYDGTTELNKGTTELKNETASIEQKTDKKINNMIDSISGSSEVKSFISDKNTNVKSVQFVIKTDAIEIPEAEEQESNQEEKLTFWQKLLKLFKIAW